MRKAAPNATPAATASAEWFPGAKMPIYTKKGDKGETGLFSKDKNIKIRIPKSDVKIMAIGAIDEANTSIGVAAAYVNLKDSKEALSNIQNSLFCIGSILAGADIKFSSSKTTKLEKLIDQMDRELPVLANFVLPGGSAGAAHLQQSRSIVRRAEREVAALSQEEKISMPIKKYLNRLSDYLFTLARFENFKSGYKEAIWKTK